MAIMVLFVMLFSSSFIAGHVHHHCTGEDCPICACLQQCESILRSFGNGIAAFVAAVLPLLVFSASESLPGISFTWDTPVSRKVRIND